jgi:glycine C-acetyltransferase
MTNDRPLKFDVRSGLRRIMSQARRVDLKTRAGSFKEFWQAAIDANESLYFREILGPQGREVTVRDSFTGEIRQMLMFGSNNYLGLADNPYVSEKSIEALREYGSGLGGPPLLNGYTRLMRELEERIADLKGAEAAIIYPTGYQANLSLVTCLPERGDLVLCDEAHHASLFDGLKMAGVPHKTFKHNDLEKMEEQLIEFRSDARDAFVFIESVHSMNSDLAPIPEVLEICRKYSTYLIVDDAHGTGVLGKRGRGVSEHFDLEGEIDIVMGTFSKAFASVGGFAAGPSHLIAYLKFYSRPYMFSAALPPSVLAGVHACLDLLEKEPERVRNLRDNVRYVIDGLAKQGIETSSEGGCVPLLVPPEINIRRAAFAFHELGLFMNPIEWPAVPREKQRFRISLMATHIREDLDALLEAIERVWSLDEVRE